VNQSNRTAINRANAQHSTGPRTEDGKERSSLNALRHGLTSQAVVLPSEDPAAYQSHLREFLDEYKPQGPIEKQFVKLIADVTWRLNRITILEDKLLTLPTAETLTEQVRALATPSMHQHRLGRQFERAVDQLSRIQAERKSRQSNQMDDAVKLYQMHQDKNLSYDPAEDGFVFSIEDIETYIRRQGRLEEAEEAEENRLEECA